MSKYFVYLVNSKTTCDFLTWIILYKELHWPWKWFIADFGCFFCYWDEELANWKNPQMNFFAWQVASDSSRDNKVIYITKLTSEPLFYFALLVIYIYTTRFKKLKYNSVWKLLTVLPGNDLPVFLITKCFMLVVKGFLDSPLHAIH